MITLNAAEMGCIRAALKQLTTRKLKRSDAAIWREMVDRLQEKLEAECKRVTAAAEGIELQLEELEIESYAIDFSDLRLPSFD